MASQEFFQQRPQVHPTIYAYSLVGVESHKGFLKVGFTERDVETRIKEQLHTSGVPYKIQLSESAMRMDGSCFTDHDVHTILRKRGFQQLNAGEDRNEWFRCTVNDVLAAIVALRTGIAMKKTEPRPSKCVLSNTTPLTKRWNTSRQPRETNLTAFPNSSGMLKCVLVKPSPPISLPRK